MYLGMFAGGVFGFIIALSVARTGLAGDYGLALKFIAPTVLAFLLGPLPGIRRWFKLNKAKREHGQ